MKFIILLVIFGALYYGYPKYQDKKLAEQIRTELKKPVSSDALMQSSKMPPELKQHLIASIENRYPTLHFQVMFKMVNKSDFNKNDIDAMKKLAFTGACQGFYGNVSQGSEHQRKIAAKIIKEDQIKLSYTLKDKMGQVVFEHTDLMSNCYGFSQFELGKIPSQP